MTATDPRTRRTADRPSAPPRGVDLARWPEMAPPKPAPLRAAIARTVMRRVADRARLRVELPDGACFGPADAAVIRILSPDSFFTRLGRDGKIGFGESYMAGDWDAPDLAAAIEPLARQVGTLIPARLQWLRRWYDAHQPASEDNDRNGARQNIARHYDLSNDLFALFLDETMTYSSALFADPSRESLTHAQHRKIDRLLDQTGVTEGTRLLEIGTGWGELAIRAAKRGAKVTTITLSVEQASLAVDRARAAGVSDSIEVLLRDYRDVTGTYDAIVSVEMIEAVGEKWWPAYFSTLDARLAPGGRIGIQAIVMPHDRMLASRRSWTWIHKYIFPGGLLPSVRAIEEIVGADTTLQIADQLSFGQSYAETLARWRESFEAHARDVEALGFDDTFRRMWTFYLAYCQGGFAAGYLDVVQLLLTRGATP
ncbi:MAG TPA: cyclopropane-fatty-acyl-phospholipid synthase family protein [Mycobacteriales bacterium]|nr:cyclopropane-fatty-acyl-phospholipid synthase family protein [Mycobacteriales bacterium]